MGGRKRLSKNPSCQEWSALYIESERQAILGVMLVGIGLLPTEQKPPQLLLLRWIAAGEMIRHQNELVNRRCYELSILFANANRRYCILKGQGNARMYLDPYSRDSGDIDIWLDGGKRSVVNYVHSIYPNVNVQYHHMSFPVYDDVEVEIHYYPSFCYNKFHNRKLQGYFRSHSEEQFTHCVRMEGVDGSLCIPTDEFNLVFQLSHMMRHFFTQGIGLRHVIDYFYLLSRDISENQKKDAIDAIRRCGMYKFLCAIMWIETVFLGLRKNTDFAPANDKAGEIVLQEMMKGGNFGKGYCYNKRKNVISVYFYQMFYRLHFIREFPSEPLWRPLALVWDYVKKRIWLRGVN